MRKWLSVVLVFAALAVGFACKSSTSPEDKPTIVSFSANPTSIHSGESSTLSWNVTDATSLSIDQGVGAVTGATGTKVVSPTATTTYTLTATNAKGSKTRTTTVTIQAQLPTITSFTATPASMKKGETSLLAWDVSNATSISIDNGIGTVSATGSQNVTLDATTTYTLSATNADGTQTGTATVTILPQAAVALTFNPAPPVWTYDSGTDTTSSTFSEVLTESNGVATHIEDAWTGLYIVTGIDTATRIGSVNFGSGELAANGTLTLGPHTESGTGRANLFAVLVEGTDSNGYPLTIRFYGNITWVGASGMVQLQPVTKGLTDPRIMRLFEDIKH